MKYVEAPNYSVEVDRLHDDDCLFLAGSITGAKDWQSEIVKLNPYKNGNTLEQHFHIFNPRRADFDVTNPDVEQEQITWEFHCLEKCKNVLFWFSGETLAPITLFEFGWMLGRYNTGKNIYVGVDPEYKRKNDVLIQTMLRDNNIHQKIVFHLEELVREVMQDCCARKQRK